MKLNWFNNKGETLIETIIALSVLAIGVSISSTVILNSIRNLTNAKNRIIGINIAREGIEAVRSIRDTNWLYYSDRRRQCWNHDPSSGVTCDGLNPIPPGTYIVYKHSDQSWRLQLADSNPAVDSGTDFIPDNDLDLVPLTLVDVDPTVDSDNADEDNDPATGAGNDADMYNHMLADSPLGTEVKTTNFSRYVTIEYLPNVPPPPGNQVPPDDSINTLDEWNHPLTLPMRDELNRMRVTSVVIWKQGTSSHSSELETILTDHLGREDLKT